MTRGDGAGASMQLPATDRAGGVVEPHLAIDPADPRRVAVAATYPGDRNPRGIGRGIWCWRTTDAGRTWNGSRVRWAEFDGEGAADPQLGYGPDGALIAVAMVKPTDYVAARQAEAATFTRRTSPTIADVKERHETPKTPEFGQVHPLCMSRSEDHGRSWSSTVIPGSPPCDKPSLAVDTRADSPHRGNAYVAWQDFKSGQLVFARSVDGGRTVEPAFRIGGRNGSTICQVAVGRGGAVHLVWHLAFRSNPDCEDPRAPRAIFHARSDDGGASFSEPVVIAEHGALDEDGRLDRMGVCTLATSPSGALLLAWSEADPPPPERGAQVRNTVRWIASMDGRRWSAPAPLSTVPPSVSQGLPAVASTKHAWHVLTYEASPVRTTVRIHSAGHDALVFSASRELAARGFGSNDLYMHGNYQLRSAGDIAIVGDYVGLAGSGNVLASAIVLPETDDWRSTTSAYAAVLRAE